MGSHCAPALVRCRTADTGFGCDFPGCILRSVVGAPAVKLMRVGRTSDMLRCSGMRGQGGLRAAATRSAHLFSHVARLRFRNHAAWHTRARYPCFDRRLGAVRYAFRNLRRHGQTNGPCPHTSIITVLCSAATG